MKYQKWIKYFFLYGLSFCITFSGFNFAIDPYGVFGNHYIFCKVKNHFASDRMTKIYYIKREMPKTILIGTSRIGALNPKTVEKFTKDRVYNLSLSGSSIKEQYMYIKFLIEKLKVKNIIWGIDFFSFNPSAKLPFAFSKDRVTKNIYIKDYIDALLSMDAFWASLATIKDNIFSKQQSKTNLFTGQNNFLERKEGLLKFGKNFLDKKIKEGLKGYKNTKALYGSKIFLKPTSIDKNFTYIKKTIQLCKKNGVNLYIYISPIYIKTLKLIYDINLNKTYEHFLIKLSQLKPYWVFDENPTIISNKENFWDNSHIREKIGDEIIKTIFSNQKRYGRLITYKNVNTHINKIKQLIKSDKK